MSISANTRPLVARYKHDCRQCNLIGQLLHEDVYYCTNEGSLILRDGDAGGEYASFPVEVARLVAKGQQDMSYPWLVAVALFDHAQATDEQVLVYRGEVG